MRTSDFEAKFDAGADLTRDLDLGRARRVNHGRPQVLCYVVAASRNPDRIDCAVPYRIDDREIFFGPCKKALRERMRIRYLNETTGSSIPPDDVYVVGFSGGNGSRTRKVLWIGKLMRVMTFAFAHGFLNGPRYRRMRERQDSPLHVRPIVEAGRLVGYEHRSELHADRDAWILDLVRFARSPRVRKEGRRLLLRGGASAWAAFPRDACLLFENVFSASGRGREVDDRLVAILQDAQRQQKVDRYAIFGYRANGTVDGKTGSHLPVSGDCARDLVDWIRQVPPTPRLPPAERGEDHGLAVPHASRRC
jgi:hypothetical protein